LFYDQPWTGNGTFDVVLLIEETSTPNSPPVAGDDQYYVWHDTPLTEPAPGVLANDSDPDFDPLTAVLETGATNGTATLNADGSFDYTPNPGFAGTDSFTYRASDGFYVSNIATVTIDVQNDTPVASDDAYYVWHDTPLNEPPNGVLGNDTDADPLSAVLVGGTANGALVLNSNGSFDYTPNSGFVGIDSFTYRANDGVEDSNIATVTIDVQNDTPLAEDDWYYTEKDMTLDEPAPGVLANDGDLDPLNAVLVGGAGSGTVVLNSDGSFNYTPNPGFVGTDSFTYLANDGIENSNIATVTIEVQDWSYLTLDRDPNATDLNLEPITTDQVALVARGAIARWLHVGVDASQMRTALAGLDVHVVDLPGARLSATAPGVILVDEDAAGYGWFVDATPYDDSEFQRVVAENELQAEGRSAAVGRVDLLTAVTHEIGHLLGLGDVPPGLIANNIMTGTLSLSTRRLPTREDIALLSEASRDRRADTVPAIRTESSADQGHKASETNKPDKHKRPLVDDAFAALVDEVIADVFAD